MANVTIRLLMRENVSRGMARASRSLRNFDKDLGSIGKKRSIIGGLGDTMMNAFVKPFILFGKMALVTNALSQALSALTAGATSLAGSLGPALVGSFAALVGVAGVLGQAFGVLKFAASGVGKALGGNKKAFDNLTPTAQRFVTALRSLAPEFKKLKEQVQSKLFAGLDAQIKTTATQYLPLLKKAFGDTAKVLNQFATRFLELARTKEWKSDFTTITNSNSRALKSLSGVGINIITIFKNLWVAMGPLIERFAKWLLKVTDTIAKMTTAKKRTGELTTFFQRAGDKAAQWGRILGNVAVALFNTFKIGKTQSDDMTTRIEKLTKKWKEWTKTLEGKNKISQWFKDGNERLKAFIKLLKDLRDAWDEVFGKAGGVGTAGVTREEANTRTGKSEVTTKPRKDQGNGGHEAGSRIEQIRTEWVPAIKDLMAAFKGSDNLKRVVGLLGDWLDAMAAIGKSDAIDDVLTFLEGLKTAIKWLNDNLPGFNPLMKTFFEILLFAQTLKLLYIASGLRAIAAAMLLVGGASAGAGAAGAAGGAGEATGLAALLVWLSKFKWAVVAGKAIMLAAGLKVLWDGIKKGGSLNNSIRTIGSALKDLGSVITPDWLGSSIKNVGGAFKNLGAAIAKGWNESFTPTVSGWWNKSWEFTKNTASNAWHAIFGDSKDKSKATSDVILTNFQGLTTGTDIHLKSARDIFNTHMQQIAVNAKAKSQTARDGINDNWKKAKPDAVLAFGGIPILIGSKLATAADVAAAGSKTAREKMRGNWTGAKTDAGGAFLGIDNIVNNKSAHIAAVAAAGSKTAREKMRGNWTGAKTDASGAFIGIAGAVSTNSGKVVTAASAGAKTARERMRGSWTGAKTDATGAFVGIAGTVKANSGKVVTAASAGAKTARERMRGSWTGAKTDATNAFTGIAGTAKTKTQAAATSAAAGAKTARERMRGSWTGSKTDATIAFGGIAGIARTKTQAASVSAAAASKTARERMRGNWTGAKTDAVNAFTGIAGTAKTKTSQAATSAAAGSKTAREKMRGNWTGSKTDATNAFNGIASVAKTKTNEAATSAGAGSKTAREKMRGNWTGIKNDATTSFKGMAGAIAGAMTGVQTDTHKKSSGTETDTAKEFKKIWTGGNFRFNALRKDTGKHFDGIKTDVGTKSGAATTVVLANWVKMGARTKSSFDAIKKSITDVWGKVGTTIKLGVATISKEFDKLKNIVTKVMPKAFKDGAAAIGKGWHAVGKAFAAPVDYILTSVWPNFANFIEKALKTFGVKSKLPRFSKTKGFATGGISAFNDGVAVPGSERPGFARGGVLPGYSPGRDNLSAHGPGGQRIGLSGGESIMRPEWTRAMGASNVHAMNRTARNQGVSGVRNMLGFAGGGVFDGLDPVFRNLKGSTGNISASKKSLMDNGIGFLWEKAGGRQIEKTVDKLISKGGEPGKLIGGGSKNTMMQAVSWAMNKIAEKVGSGGDVTYANASERLKKALAWAKTQAGKPYQWGGGGNPSYDCSGFMASIQRVIQGMGPGRLYTTHNFTGNSAPAGWVRSLQSPFEVGVTAKGVGHMAGTLLGQHVESAGSRGVNVGPRARGAHDPYFDGRWYGYKPVAKEATASGGSAGKATKGKASGGNAAFDTSGKQWFGKVVTVAGIGGSEGGGGNAAFTSFGGEGTASGGSASDKRVVAVNNYPLHTMMNIQGSAGTYNGAEVLDFGPASWVQARYGTKQVIDLGPDVAKKVMGSWGGNGSGNFAVTKMGSGKSYRQINPKGDKGVAWPGGIGIGAEDGGIIGGGLLENSAVSAIAGERGSEIFRKSMSGPKPQPKPKPGKGGGRGSREKSVAARKAIAEAKKQAALDHVRWWGREVYLNTMRLYGPGDDNDSFGGIRSAAMHNAKTPKQGGRLRTYMRAFIKARRGAKRESKPLWSDGGWGGDWGGDHHMRGFASGGHMKKREVGLVGENGPELFFAGNSGGHVMNSGLTNAALKGGNPVQLHVAKSHGNSDSEPIVIHFHEKVFVKDEREFKKMVVSAIGEAKRKGELR